MVSLQTEHIRNKILGNSCLYNNIMTGILPRCKSFHCKVISSGMITQRASIAIVLIAFLFAFAILCLFSVLFVALCRRAPQTTRSPQRNANDAESSSTAMGERTAGRASVYHEYNLGHELPQNRIHPALRHHRLPPLLSKRDSQDTIETITPTASRPVIFGDEDQMCVVQVVVTPPTPAKRAG